MNVQMALLKLINDMSKKEGVPTLVVIEEILNKFVVVPKSQARVIETDEHGCPQAAVRDLFCEGVDCNCKRCRKISQIIIVEK